MRTDIGMIAASATLFYAAISGKAGDPEVSLLITFLLLVSVIWKLDEIKKVITGR